ncbi:MAG: PAS domain S-box protein [Nitrospirales bacterium]|nr:MAG: PAS domain S-box protein [Nitrospirales bacterium]
MGNPPFVLVSWMVAAMFVVGASLTWGWSWWVVGLLGISLLTAAYRTTQKAWNQTCDKEEKIRASLVELQQITKSQESRPPRSFSPESLGLELQQTVNHIQKRMGNLEEERAKISAIVQNLLEGVVAFDPQGHVLFSNASACRILGLEEPQLQGRSVWEVIRNKELAELVERCRALGLHERQRVEVAIHTPSRMTVEVYGLPFPLANKKKGSVIVLHDVTKLRRLEQVRAEFIDNVSHELRTPLAAIIGYLETLIDEPSLETPNNRKFVHVAHQHAERLNRLVDDLRSLSEIESGKVILRWESVALKDVVDEVTEMLQSQGQKKGLHFLNQIAETDYVWADRDRVVQILVNLVDNAIKYSLEGGSISFLVQRLDQSIVFQVKDTGQGIPSTELSRITERFYRVDRARSRDEGGTGLGLSIVKHLVQLLNGQLRIQSDLGKGTTVEVVLPISTK